MRLFEISNEQWITGDDGCPEYLCQLPFNVCEAEKVLNVEFFEHEENGLGSLYSCYMTVSGIKFWLRGFGDKVQKTEPVAVYLRNEKDKSSVVLDLVLNLFSLTRNELKEVNEEH